MEDKVVPRLDGGNSITPVPEGIDPPQGYSGMKGVTSVIVLSFNKFSETTGRCLDSLAEDPEFSGWDVIIVDNASDQKTRISLATAGEKFPSVRLILSETNRGFAGGMNLGMRRARGDVFILLNSDTIVPPGTIARITHAIRSRPEIGLLGPVTNAAGNEQGIFTKSARVQDAISEGIEFANAVDSLLPIPVYRLDFCCVAMRRDVCQTVGELDESFGRGYYEDFDYSLRVRNAGFELAILEEAFIYHHGSASFKELGREIRKLIARNKALLLEKHGKGIKFPHSRDANLSVLNQYALMSEAGHPPPRYRVLNRLALAKADRPRSWWKRWRHDRRVAKVEQSLQNLDPGPARRQ
jgi:GT2 family glycosyltransferase